MRARLIGILVAAVLVTFAAVMPGARRHVISAIITWDAPAEEPVKLAGDTTGPGLAPADRVRVLLIDGLDAATAQRLPTWTSLCKKGVQLTVDVGFPTVSLPVEVSLWTGLTQQQTGVVFRSDRPLVPPLDRRGMPAQVPGSIAIAEHHGYIVRSLGFTTAEPAAADDAARDADAAGWAQRWQTRATEAVASDARLVFVHVLRVDTWGHKKGGASTEYASAASESDAILAQLHAASPDARWFLLSDHGHLAGGGHGGEDHTVRQVEHCIVGPGIAPANGGPVHLVDVSRALADSLGVPLDRRSPGRPLPVALAHPLSGDDAIPPLPLGRGAVAVLLLALGAVALGASVRHWWLAPYWFVAGCLLLLIVRGAPTMSMPMVYGKESLFDLFDGSRRLMMRTWLPVLPLATVATWFGLARTSLWRVLGAQLAFPLAALAAAITACRGWTALLGAHTSPMEPHYTALALVLMVIVAQGSAAVALGVLARSVLPASGRPPPSETPRSAP